MTTDHFAISLDINTLMEKINRYYQDLYDIQHTSKMQRSHAYFHGRNASSLQRSGSQGQLTKVSINDFRGILTHAQTLITSQPPAFDCRSVNSDYTSQIQALLGEQILSYYLREKKLMSLLKKAVGFALRYSEGFIAMSWQTSLGRVIGVDNEQRVIQEGDIEFSVLQPLQVIRDIYSEKRDWVILAERTSVFDLQAMYPEADIKPDNNNRNDMYRNLDYLSQNTSNRNRNADSTTVYTLYHAKTAALPEGRFAVFTESGLLNQGPLPYEQGIPVYRIAPEDLDGTCLGSTLAFDLLSIQDASDQLYSAVLSNNLTFSRQCIQTSKDSDISVSDIGQGLMLLETEAPIQPVQLTKSAPETYTLIGNLLEKMQSLSGVNEVVRGTPGANLRSGSALALVAAQALIFNSSLQSSWNDLFEDVGTATLRFLKTFAISPRFASIVGRAKRAFIKEFQASDIDLVDRVVCEQSSGVSRTTAGKLELATNLLQQGLIKNPSQYLMVLETGQLDPLTEPSQVELLLIRHENELLMSGQQVIAIMIDTHAQHVLEHRAVLANPESRFDPSIVQNTLDHIQQHIDLNRSADPALLQMIQEQPLPPAQQQPPSASPSQVMQPQSAQEQTADMPAQPELPQQADALSQQAYAQMQQMTNQ